MSLFATPTRGGWLAGSRPAMVRIGDYLSAYALLAGHDMLG